MTDALKTEEKKLRALELFCGIGGFASATIGSNLEVVAAVDQNEAALRVYRHNFPRHPVRKMDLERITTADLAGFEAHFWWLSPPCQPYCVRGRRHDLEDARASSLNHITNLLAAFPDESLPRHLALENVPGFAVSVAREQLVAVLGARDYELRECHLCPTQLGVPSRRPRYYLVASRMTLAPAHPLAPQPLKPLPPYLTPSMGTDPPAELQVDEAVLERFGSGLRILDPSLPGCYTTCFTSGYGKSIMHAGSYLRTPTGVRRFGPEEIARLLHFPDQFRFPDAMPVRRRWHLVGNSLSVAAVREVLRAIPELSWGATISRRGC